MGGSQASESSVALIEVTLTLCTDADVTMASVVTVTSTNSPSRPTRSETPFDEYTWNLYVVTGLRPEIVTLVSLNISCNYKQ